MIPLNDLIDFCRAEALAGKLWPTEISDYRWFCREYSKTFHTPLHLVLEMEAEHVILSVLEEGMDTKSLSRMEDFEKIQLELRRLEDPNYDANNERAMEDWTAGIEQWEKNRVAKGSPLPKKGKQEPTVAPKPLPKEGGINLAYLSKEEESDPNNGFDE